MRQPQVAARLTTLAAALLVAAPVVLAGRSLAVAALFLIEFLSDGAVPALTRVTPQPRAASLDAATARYRPGLTAGVPLVLVHGLAPEGKNALRLAVGEDGSEHVPEVTDEEHLLQARIELPEQG